MAAPPPPVVPHRTVTIQNVQGGPFVFNKPMIIVTLADRRPSAPSAPREWMLQADLEDLLYPSVISAGTAGAFYRLLKRSRAGSGMSLPLRRASVASGLVTEAEFEALKALLHHSVRVFTLVPMEAVEMAVETYGPTADSEALLQALGMPRPESWDAGAAEDGAGDDDDRGACADQLSDRVLWAAALAVLATLRLEFAASTAIALGIVDMVKFPACRIATPAILALLGPTLKHWCTPLIEFTLGFIAIIVAWYAKATIAAFYAAVRGGKLFVQGVFGFIVDQSAKGIQMCLGLVGKDFDPNESVLDEIVGFIIAAQGFMFQLTQGFVLPFPFNVLLSPLSMVEWFLRLLSVTSTGGVPAV